MKSTLFLSKLALLVVIPFFISIAQTEPALSLQKFQMQHATGINLKDLNEKYRNAIVKIEFTSISNLSETKLNPTKSERYIGGSQKGSHGTGFFIKEDEVLTNYHIVMNARKGSIYIKSPATGNLKFKVEVIGIGGMGTIDLAVLKFPKDEQMRFLKRSGLQSIPCLKLGESAILKQSDPLAILGYPNASDELKVIKAEVTGRQYQNYGLRKIMGKHHYIEVGPGGVIQSGNSGGPALDRKGSVVGIPTLVGYGGNQGWLIPIDIVKKFLDRIRNNRIGKVSLNIPVFGVKLSRNTVGNLVLSGTPEDITLFELGVVIRETSPQGMATKWGLKTGDIIVGFANKQKGISCALDFEGYRVTTGKMSKWPQSEKGLSNLDKFKIHFKELIFTSNIGDEITLWYIRSREKESKTKLRTLHKKVDIDPESILPQVGLYDKPDYEYWGDFVVQDFNNFNTNVFNVPLSEIYKGGVLVTYVEPNSLASHRGLEIGSSSRMGYYSSLYKGRKKEWYIIETVNGKAVKNLEEFKKKLRLFEKAFERKKESKDYKQERKFLYKERYVKLGIRTNSFEGKVASCSTTFPIDEAVECCK